MSALPQKGGRAFLPGTSKRRLKEVKVHFGCCAGLDKLEVIAQAGFDYIEPSVNGTVAPLEGPEKLEEARQLLAGARIGPEAFNLFVPGSVRLVGPEVQWETVTRYVTTACERVSELGGRIIVFGSGGARRRPDEFPQARAREQLERFLKLAGDAAQEAGVQIAIEPLRQAETNVVNTVAEAFELAKDVKHPGVHVLADLYHMAAEEESFDVLSGVGGRLIHVHLAEPPDRTAPGTIAYDFRPFLRALAQIGYRGRVSVECRWEDFPSQLPRALAVLRQQWAEVTGC